MKKLTKKFVLLAALTMMLGVFAFTDLGTTQTGAAPCCSVCDDIYFECELLEPGTIQDRCYRRAFNCYRWCIWSC